MMKSLNKHTMYNTEELMLEDGRILKAGCYVIVTTNEKGEVINGTEYDKELIEELLEIGTPYEVSNVDVHNWHTKVSLTEFPLREFNSVNFEVVEAVEVFDKMEAILDAGFDLDTVGMDLGICIAAGAFEPKDCDAGIELFKSNHGEYSEEDIKNLFREINHYMCK